MENEKIWTLSESDFDDDGLYQLIEDNAALNDITVDDKNGEIFGSQIHSIKKYKGYLLKIIILCLYLASIPMDIDSIPIALKLTLKTYTKNNKLKVPSADIIRKWVKYYGDDVNVENIKYLIKNQNVLRESATFHHDGSSMGATQYTSCCISCQSIKNALQHNQKVIDDDIEEKDEILDEKVDENVDENEYKFIIKLNRKKALKISAKSSKALQCEMNIFLLRKIKYINNHLHGNEAEIEIPNVSHISLMIIYQFLEKYQNKVPKKKKRNTSLKTYLARDLFHFLDLKIMDSIELWLVRLHIFGNV